jgi:hypothetical protein
MSKLGPTWVDKLTINAAPRSIQDAGDNDLSDRRGGHETARTISVGS